MSVRHAPKPSPLAGEGAERRRREAGEGSFVAWNWTEGNEFSHPSPGASQALGATLSRKGRGDGARCSIGEQQ